jgi:hypothetical protein
MSQVHVGQPSHHSWTSYGNTHKDQKHSLVGGLNHLEKYESQWEGLSHILWKIKNVPNHQPA